MIATSARTSSGCTSGVGFAIAKTIDRSAIVRIACRRHGAGDRDADEHVRALEQLVGRPAALVGVRALRERHAGRVQVDPVAVDHAELVADDDLTDPLCEQDVRARRARRSCAGHDHAHVLRALADDPQRVQQRRQQHDRRAVLVVVEDGDVELRAQPPLDLEAPRRRDVLEVDPAERRRHRLDHRDDLVDVLRGQAQRVGVDARELLEQQRLALHDRHRRLRPDVAEAEDRGPVGHDGDRVALHREVPSALGVLVDRLRHARDARRVGHREVVAGLDRHGAVHADLAPQVQLKRPVGDGLDADAVDLLDRPHHRLAVRGVDARHRDVADDLPALDAHEVDRAEDAALVADRARDEPERARPLRQPDAHRDAVGRRRLQDGVPRVSHDARRAWARRGP